MTVKTHGHVRNNMLHVPTTDVAFGVVSVARCAAASILVVKDLFACLHGASISSALHLPVVGVQVISPADFASAFCSEKFRG